MAAAAAEGSPFHIIATYNCRRRDREGARGWTRAVGSALGGGKRRMGEKLVRAFKNPSSWLGFLDLDSRESCRDRDRERARE